MSVVQEIRRVARLAVAPAWAAPTIILLGLGAAGLEAIGLWLFVPLIQALGGHGFGGGAVPEPVIQALARLRPGLAIPMLVAALCAAIAGKNLLVFAGGYAARYVDGMVAHRLRLKVFAQTLSACADYRLETRATDIAATLANNTWKVSQALSLVYRLAICACTFAVFLALLLVLSAPLTGLAVALLGASALLVHLTTRRAQAAGQGVVEENRRFGLRMWESMGALQLIRTFAREDYELERLGAASNALRRRMLALDVLWAIPGPVGEVVGTALIGALVLAGVATGAPLGALAAFLALLYRLQGPVREFMSCKVALEGLGPAVADVDTHLAATATPYLESGETPARPLRRGIEFRDVSFRYAPDEPPALERVSFELPAGKTTAIVGRSGAGKSTLMSLIFRFRDPASGAVLADGTPLADLDLAGWRGRLSLMSQEAQLFNDTVAANIAYADLDARPEQIAAAAQVAGAHGFITALPQGYDTELGDRGMRLSGGQKQRIALARAILKAPDVLLLDEPTSSVDPETERAFQAALEAFARGRTVVVIAHRLSTVMAADQVVVLEAGRVVEAGAPHELVGRPGHFARLHGLSFAEEAA